MQNQQTDFEDWLERKYGHLQLTPRHLSFARAVYEEEQLKNRRYTDGDD